MQPTLENSIIKTCRSDIERKIKKLVISGNLTADTKSLYVYLKDILQNRLYHLNETFPKTALHAIAIKTNSHPLVLKEIVRFGCGLEAASFEEVELAIQAGCEANKIVFDSPVKTKKELAECADRFPEITINANCFAELERIQKHPDLKVGIRINPLMNMDTPGIFNVSSKNSKFGIPISEGEKIIRYALEMDQVCGLHIHAGSEIGNQANHVEAILKVVDLAEEIKARGKKLEFIDIGGGISADIMNLKEFYDLLIHRAPRILDYRIITEYGRFVHTHCAFVISKVEYILDHCVPNIALIHVGADLFPREIYSSNPPKHDFYTLDSEGNLKSEGMTSYDIGGPLCFSGDFLTRNYSLPSLDEGDFIVISDTGANSLSMWSRHCSREEVEVEVV